MLLSVPLFQTRLTWLLGDKKETKYWGWMSIRKVLCVCSVKRFHCNTGKQFQGQHGVTFLNVSNWSFVDHILGILCVSVEKVKVWGDASSSSSLKPHFQRVELSYSLSAGSHWHRRDNQRRPICLCFFSAILQHSWESLCDWHIAADRHRLGMNNIFSPIGTHCESSPSLSNSFSQDPSFLPDVLAIVFFPMIKVPFLKSVDIKPFSLPFKGCAAWVHPSCPCWCTPALCVFVQKCTVCE